MKKLACFLLALLLLALPLISRTAEAAPEALFSITATAPTVAPTEPAPTGATTPLSEEGIDPSVEVF